jgi:Ala-tRNA(Pro) deacylase
MTTLQACLDYLDLSGVRYTHTSHPVAYTARDVADAEFMPAHRVAKTVVFRSNDSDLLAVVPADAYVDVEQLHTATGAHGVRKATENEISLLFPHAEVGAMAPITDLAGMPVYLDRELADQEFIAFNAGTHRDLIHMKMADFKHLVQPVIGDFSRPDYSETSFAAGF